MEHYAHLPINQLARLVASSPQALMKKSILHHALGEITLLFASIVEHE